MPEQRDEPLQSLRRLGSRARGGQIEEQAADDGEGKACEGGVVDGGGLGGRAQPGVDGGGNQLVERDLAVRTAGVALEEQSLEGPERGIAQVSPQLKEPVGGRRVQRFEHPLLASFHLLHHRDQQRVARTEMVDEHPMAGAGRGSDVTQRSVA